MLPCSSGPLAAAQRLTLPMAAPPARRHRLISPALAPTAPVTSDLGPSTSSLQVFLVTTSPLDRRSRGRGRGARGPQPCRGLPFFSGPPGSGLPFSEEATIALRQAKKQAVLQVRPKGTHASRRMAPATAACVPALLMHGYSVHGKSTLLAVAHGCAVPRLAAMSAHAVRCGLVPCCARPALHACMLSPRWWHAATHSLVGQTSNPLNPLTP